MLIGIVSDTHGKADRLRRAMSLLVARSAQAVVHCGDLGSFECLEAMAEFSLPCYAVGGNMDCVLEDLEQRARLCGVQFGRDFICVPIDQGRTLAVTHGNNPAVLASLASGEHAYLCHGHTHQMRNEQIDQLRVINPGALHHARPLTIALLDTQADTVEFIQVA